MRLLLPVLLAIELSLHCQVCDLHFKFEENRTKTAVAIEDDMYFGETDRQTDIHSTDFISAQCYAYALAIVYVFRLNATTQQVK